LYCCRAIKNEVGKFFGIVLDEKKREIRLQKWNENAQKMHGRSMVTKRKAVDRQKPYSIEMDEVDSGRG
jgi:hypothetical protein